jgi:hypothetical protein
MRISRIKSHKRKRNYFSIKLNWKDSRWPFLAVLQAPDDTAWGAFSTVTFSSWDALLLILSVCTHIGVREGWGWGGDWEFIYSGNDCLVIRRIYWSIKRNRSIISTSSTFTGSIMHCESVMATFVYIYYYPRSHRCSSMLRQVNLY